jgi:4-alpha-glucanotransferase
VAARKRALSTKSEYQRTIRLKVRAPQLRMGEKLAIVGEPELLGAWNAQKAIVMDEH